MMTEYLPWISILVVFTGMAALVWKALTISHDLAKLALQQMPILTPSILKPSAAVPSKSTPTIVAPPLVPDTVIDEGLVNYIKKEEGFKAKAYWDYKQWSIGYGTRANSSTEIIDEAEGDRRLRLEIVNADRLVTSFAPQLTKGLHQALLDLTYNAGSGWEHQSLGDAVKANKIDTIKADIALYNHAGGQVNSGLTKRRADEISWIDNPL